jgi:hypothetical protein
VVVKVVIVLILVNIFVIVFEFVLDDKLVRIIAVIARRRRVGGRRSY